MCGGDKPYLGIELLEVEHARCQKQAIQLFKAIRKMGGPEFSQAYLERLESELGEVFESFQKHNEGKNIFAAARTPATLFMVMVVFYVVAGILAFIGIESLAGIANLGMGIAILLLGIWAYVRYSGEYRDIGMKIDQLAETIWEQVDIHLTTTLL